MADGVMVQIVEVEQEMGGEFATIITLATGQQFKCARPELFVEGQQGRLATVFVRTDGAIEYEQPVGVHVTLMPIWLRGDPRQPGSPAR